MGNAETLDILIRAQAQTQAAFEKARKDLENLGNQGKKTNDYLGMLAKGLGAVGIAFSAAAVVGFAKEILDTAGNIADLSAGLGISTDAVQDFKTAAEDSGATIDNVGQAIQKLNDEAASNSDAFGKLGLNIDKVLALSPEDRFREVANALKAIEDPAVRAARGHDLLGKSYDALAASIDNGIGSMSDANKMSKETVETLDALGDGIGHLLTSAKNFGGTAIAKAVNDFQHMISETGKGIHALFGVLHLDTEGLKTDVSDLIDRFKILRDGVTNLPKAPGAPSLFKGEGAVTPKALGSEEVAQIEEALNKERKALDETAKAADAHAQKVKALSDAIFGRTAIAAANDYLQALGSVNNLSKLSAEEQKKLNAAALEAIEAYDRLGTVAPAALNQVYVLTAQLPEATRGITDVVKDLGREAEATIPILYDLPKPVAITSEELELLGRKSSLTLKDLIPEAAKKSTDHLDELARSISQMATVAGGSFGSVVSGLGTIVTAADTAVKSIRAMKAAGESKGSLEGILGMATGIMGIVSAALQAGKAIAGLFDRSKGRDLVVDFASSLGGFDELHKKLGALGDEGEQLWIKLTQGVGRNNPEQAKAAIDEVTAALDKQKTAHDEVASAADKAQQSSLNTLMERLDPAEAKALAAGYQQAISEGFKGGQDDFFQQQLEFYGKLEEGDSRLKTWFSGTTIAAFKLIKSGQTELFDQLSGDIKKIDDQIGNLQDSIAGEAPEEFMGVVERETRDRIAKLADERQKLQEQLQQQQEDTKDATADTADGVDHVTDNAEAALGFFERWKRAIDDAGDSLGRLQFPGGSSDGIPGHADGAYIRRDHVAKVHAGEIIGPRDFIARALSDAMASTGGGQGGAMPPIIVQVDGREIARVNARYQKQVLAPYGVR
jgi:hypothetical protein